MVCSSIEATRAFPVECWCTYTKTDEINILAAPVLNTFYFLPYWDVFWLRQPSQLPLIQRDICGGSTRFREALICLHSSEEVILPEEAC